MVWMWRLLFCVLGSMPCFTMLLNSSMARSPSVSFTFFHCHTFINIYRCIYIYVHVHLINFTSKSSPSYGPNQKKTSKFTSKLQYLHHSHMEKTPAPPNGTRKSPAPKSLLLLNHINLCRWLCYQTKRPGGHAIRRLIASNLPATINTESWKRAIMQELGTSAKTKRQGFRTLSVLPPF